MTYFTRKNPGMIMGAWAGLSIFLVSAFASPSFAAPYQDTIAEGRAAAAAVMDSTGASSISLALVDGEQVVWAETFGLADRESKTAPTTDTMYCIGSTSKLLAAVAVIKLVDQKKVSLNAPLTRYIPSFSMAVPGYRYGLITVKDLLNHSAGFPGGDYRNSETASPVPGYSAQVMETLKDQRLKHPPGFMNVYCNDCFTLVEQLVLAVTGKTYDRFLEDDIFAPLGMTHSRYPTDYFTDGTFANRYSGDTRLPQLFLNAFGSAGLYATPTDMAKVAMMLMREGKMGGTQFLSKGSVRQMTTDQTTSDFNPVKSYGWSYGLGLDAVHQPGLKAVHKPGWAKAGDTTLYASEIILVPSEGLAAVVMGASGAFGSDSAKIIAERILLRALVEKGRIPAMPTPLSLSPLPVKKPSARLLAAMSGYYARSGALYRVEPGTDDSLTIRVWNTGGQDWQEWKSALKLRNDGRFASDADPATAFSCKTAKGRQYLVMRSLQGYSHYQDDSLYAQKVAGEGALPAPWSARIGRTWLMTNDNPEGPLWKIPAMRLRTVDNMLFADCVLGFQVVDPHVSDTRAGMVLLIPQEAGRDLNDVVIDSRSGEEWIRYGSYLFRPLETVTALSDGDNTVTIDADGLAQWRSLNVETSKRLNIVTNGRWRIYDSDLTQVDTGDGAKAVTFAAGRYYLIFHSDALVSPSGLTALQTMIDRSVSDDGVPGAILAIRRPEGTWVGAAGKASLASGAAMTPDMQVRLASVTKSLTSILVMKLVEANILSLDDTVEKWLPGLIPDGSLMTVKMLLSHKAGVYNVTELTPFWLKLLENPGKTWESSEILDMVRSLTPRFTPGTDFSYTNTGYYVLGMIVEAATGKTLSEESENRVFAPHGLTRTRLARNGFMDEPRSHGHTWLPTTETVVDNTDWNLSWDWTAGAAVSTGTDMLNLATALFSGAIVSPVTLELMTTPSEPGGYGLGIGKTTDTSVFNATLIGHTGENPGTVSYWYHFPDYDTTIFLAVNRSDTRISAETKVPVEASVIASRIFRNAWALVRP